MLICALLTIFSITFCHNQYRKIVITTGEKIAACIQKKIYRYDEIIVENNSNISVGQKQRLAIARVILKNTPIILFDEVTSALDKKSKKEIDKVIQKLSKIKTIIVIAHTLDSVENFDNIIVIKNGKIMEQGSHTYLIEEKGMYYNLLNL